MRYVPLLAFVVVAGAGCEGCDKELVAPPGTIVGRACSDVDRQGLAGKTVEVRGPKVVQGPTGGAGNFRFDNLPVGTYDVFVGDIDDAGTFVEIHQVNAKPIVVESDAEKDATDTRCGDLPNDPDTGVVEGEICNRHTGELLIAADVTITAPDGTLLGSDVTDNEGRFRIEDVLEGDHIVQIKTTGFDRSFPVTVVKDETVLLDLNAGTCAVPFGTGCTILGSLCDPDGEEGARLAGATVTVVNAAGTVNEVDVTDTAGQFYISALLPGRYDVTISKPSANVNETFVDQECVAGGETVVEGPTECVGSTPIGRLQGALCDLAELDGLFTGTVRLLQNGTERYRTTTDSNGFFSFDVLTAGTYDVHLGEPTERIYTNVVVRNFQTTILEEDSCPEPEDICTPYAHQPEVTSDGRIVFVVDRSGSMLQAASDFGNLSKWNALRDTLQSVTSSLAPNIEYSLFVYPNPANDGTTSPPANCFAGVSRLSNGTAAAMNAALDAVEPAGGTPTSATMSAVLPAIRDLADDGRPLAVVLATDGAPNCLDNPPELSVVDNCTCTSNAGNPPQSDTNCASFNCLDQVISTNAGPLAQIEALGVKTHVIGIPDVSGTVNAQTARVFTDSLNAMAIAGGAPRSGGVKYHDGSNTAALQASLQAVTRRILACQVTVSDNGVPVVLDGASSLEVRLGDAPLPQDVNRQNGWAQTGPSTIELFGSACDAATASSQSVVVRRCAPPT
jgi:hypothetical protein